MTGNESPERKQLLFGAKNMTKDVQTKEKFIELRAAGKSFEGIAQELDVSKPTLIGWSKELSMEIRNLKAIRLEALQEQYHVLQARRIELIGQKLQAVVDELDKRDLKEIPTEKLFDLLLKYAGMLKQDETNLLFTRPGSMEEELSEVLAPGSTWSA
jgi:hypothetical protein